MKTYEQFIEESKEPKYKDSVVTNVLKGDTNV